MRVGEVFPNVLASQSEEIFTGFESTFTVAYLSRCVVHPHCYPSPKTWLAGNVPPPPTSSASNHAFWKGKLYVTRIRSCA